MEPVQEFSERSEHVVASLKQKLGGIRTNRPTPALVENIAVDYYGQKLPIKQVGSIGIEPPRDIVIHVWDRGVINNLIKAIESSSLGLQASAEETSVRIHLPELSGERREELVKHAKRIVEDHRIQVRHARDEANKNIEKQHDKGEVDEDGKFKLKKAVQEETDRVNREIEELLERKIKEIKQ